MEKSLIRRTDISSLPDDAYKVTITQKNDTVRKKNAQQLGLSLMSFLIGKILDHKYAANSTSEGSTLENCLRDTSTEVLKAVENNTYNLVIHGNLKSVEEVVEAAKSTIYDSFLGVVNAKSCVKLSTSFGSKTFIKLIGKRMVTALNVYENIKTYAEFRHAAKSFIDPEELTGEMQLHFGRLLTGTVQMKKAKELEELYFIEETIYPLIKLEPISSYSDIEMEGLYVQWKVEEGHGRLNLLETKLDKDGVSNVGWTLPKTSPNLDKKVEITAEILDKEKEHIQGSPVKFKISLTDSLEFYRNAVIGNWTFEYDYLTYDDGVTQIDKKIFYKDGTGNPVSTIYVCYPRYGCTEDTFTDHTDKWGTDPFYDLVWSVTYDSFKKRYVFNSYDKRWKQNIAVELNPKMEGLSSQSFSTYNIIAIKD